MSDRQWNLISFDVSCDKRRRKVVRCLEGYGDRVQYSVFRVRCSPRTLARIRWELCRIMAATDRLIVIPLPDSVARRIQTLEGVDDWVERAEQTHFIVGLIGDSSISSKRSHRSGEKACKSDQQPIQEQFRSAEILESPPGLIVPGV